MRVPVGDSGATFRQTAKELCFTYPGLWESVAFEEREQRTTGSSR